MSADSDVKPEGDSWRLGRLEGMLSGIAEDQREIKHGFNQYGERITRLEIESKGHSTTLESHESRLDDAHKEREAFKVFMHRNAGIQYGLQLLILVVTALNLLGVIK